VLVLRSPGGAELKLIGTAHVSIKDAKYVQQAVEQQRPDAIIVEMDPQRLPRIGLTLEDLGEKAVVPPALPSEDRASDRAWWDPLTLIVAPLLRTVIAGLYTMLEVKGMEPGGEFATAIRVGLDCDARIVLGDVDSLTTLKSFLREVSKSGVDNFVRRFTTFLFEEVPLVAIDELTQEKVDSMKALFTDGRTLRRLREDVPEFFHSFIGVRDARLAAAVQAEVYRGAKSLVAVVGMAHVEGIERELGWARKGKALQK